MAPTAPGAPAAGLDTAGSLRYGTAQGRCVIAATVLGSGIASLDATVVNIALPAISRTFHSDVGTLEWVVIGYSLTLASFILIGGALGDRYGRRKVFCVGVVWFAVASAACGVAPSASLLISARLLQGVGGALLTPASLAILQASFHPDDRARAIGAWSGLGGLAAAAGPLLGGYLIAAASWRWVFYLNLPVAVTVVTLTLWHVPESRDATASGRPDALGAALAVLTLSGLTYGLTEGPSDGWGSGRVTGALAIAVVGAVAFLVAEHRLAHPMLALGLFRQRQFSAVNAVTFVIYGALGGAFFLLPVTLQEVDRYSPLESGLALLPVTVVMLIFSPRSARLASVIGPRLQMSLGPLVVAAGVALLLLAPGHPNYAVGVLPAMVVFAAGLAFTVAPLTSTALGAVPSEHAGVASAVNTVVAHAAGLIAVAVLPAVAGISGALTASSLSHGFRIAMVVAAATCAAGGVLSAATIRNPPGRRPSSSS